MTAYDSQLIYEFADRLYRQAGGIIITYTLVFAVIGGVAGLFYSNRSSYATGMSSGNTPAVVLAIGLGALGYYVGVQKAFALKLQAQTALCQVKIEENTRRS
jgi:hypothetical protein